MTQSPREMLLISIRNNDIDNFCTAFDTLRHSRRGLSAEGALELAIKEASVPIVKYLLEQEKASVAGLEPSRLCMAFTCGAPDEEDLGKKEESAIGVWEILVESGWDVNCGEPEGQNDNGDRLLTMVCHNENLVKWLLSHGAVAADPPDLDSFNSAPPILERVASSGSISTFRLLRDHGAQITQRVLHRAVQSAAYAESRQIFGERMTMVKFLVEDLDCNVNAMDVAEGQQLPNHWGTPAAYALQHAPPDRASQVVELIRYLLEKGADPSIKDCLGVMSVLDRAERAGNQEILDLLKSKKKD